MSLRPPRVKPGGHDDQLVLRITMAEGVCILGTTAGGATHLLKQHKGSGRGDVSKVGDEDVNGFVADFLYQGRFLVVLLPGGNHSVKHGLELSIRHGADVILQGWAKFPERLYDPLTLHAGAAVANDDGHPPVALGRGQETRGGSQLV